MCDHHLRHPTDQDSPRPAPLAHSLVHPRPLKVIYLFSALFLFLALRGASRYERIRKRTPHDAKQKDARKGERGNYLSRCTLLPSRVGTRIISDSVVGLDLMAKQEEMSP